MSGDWIVCIVNHHAFLTPLNKELKIIFVSVYLEYFSFLFSINYLSNSKYFQVLLKILTQALPESLIQNPLLP